jgi:Tol biopolymer transport system component
MKATGGKPRLLFKNPREDNGAITVMDPEWSPDGRRIAFSSTRFSSTWTIWTYGMDGRLVQVTKTFSVHPSWSPNGRRIAYDSPDGIAIVGLDGLGKRVVPKTSSNDQSPAWSPDGKWIAVRSLNKDWQKHEADSLDIVSPTGTVRKRLFTGNGVVTPAAWSPASDAVLVLRVPNPREPRTQLFVVLLGGGRPKPVDGTNGAAGGASWHR